MLGELSNRGHSFDVLSILRPTSPFRSVSTIRRAMTQFLKHPSADSLKAVH